MGEHEFSVEMTGSDNPIDLNITRAAAGFWQAASEGVTEESEWFTAPIAMCARAAMVEAIFTMNDVNLSRLPSNTVKPVCSLVLDGRKYIAIPDHESTMHAAATLIVEDIEQGKRIAMCPGFWDAVESFGE